MLAPLAYTLPLAFSLGIRHGLDPDHLATIDSLSRQLMHQPRLARRTGLFFSLGHGLVVMGLCLLLQQCQEIRAIPAWFKPLGSTISATSLLLLSLMSCLSLFAPTHVLPQKYLQAKALPLLIGALFALSFDTLSQIALFSLSLSSQSIGLLCLAFILGMITADGLNGWLISGLWQRLGKRGLQWVTLGLALVNVAIVLTL